MRVLRGLARPRRPSAPVCRPCSLDKGVKCSLSNNSLLYQSCVRDAPRDTQRSRLFTVDTPLSSTLHDCRSSRAAAPKTGRGALAPEAPTGVARHLSSKCHNMCLPLEVLNARAHSRTDAQSSRVISAHIHHKLCRVPQRCPKLRSPRHQTSGAPVPSAPPPPSGSAAGRRPRRWLW